MDVARAGCLLAIVLLSCGGRTIEPDQACVREQILPIAPDMITRSGRTLQAWDGWRVDQIEADGSITFVTSLGIDLEPPYLGYLEHDPVSGRMWLIAWAQDQPGWLFQFDAAGQVEWAVELDDFDHYTGGSLLYHDDSIVLAVSVRSQGLPRLLVQRRDLAGQPLWTRTDIPTPDSLTPDDEEVVFASGAPIGVSGDALSLIATPPLIDYGPSYPLTLELATGTTIWLDDSGFDPLRMIADDEHLFLASTIGPFPDPEPWPEQVELEPLRSSLMSVSPSGEESMRAEVVWPKGWRGWGENDLAFGWMGEHIVTVVEGTEHFGVTVHGKDGTLECHHKLDVELVSVRAAVGIAGREQWLAEVGVPVGEPNENGGYESERRILLLEPL